MLKFSCCGDIRFCKESCAWNKPFLLGSISLQRHYLCERKRKIYSDPTHKQVIVKLVMCLGFHVSGKYNRTFNTTSKYGSNKSL